MFSPVIVGWSVRKIVHKLQNRFPQSLDGGWVLLQIQMKDSLSLTIRESEAFCDSRSTSFGGRI